jgi:hypothetical protein
MWLPPVSRSALLRSFLFLQQPAATGYRLQAAFTKGNLMEHEEHQLAERLEQAATLLERTLTWLEERQTALTGEVEKISATVDAAALAREEELAAKLTAAEREIAELKAAAASAPANTASPAVLTSTRKTVPASTADMLAKRGIGDGPVDVRALDAALSGLSLEQRIAVKSQLLRAGSIA